MTLDQIKAEIATLPDDDIPSLFEWLGDYYDGGVWDRQIDSDVARLGADEFIGVWGAEFPPGNRNIAALLARTFAFDPRRETPA